MDVWGTSRAAKTAVSYLRHCYQQQHCLRQKYSSFKHPHSLNLHGNLFLFPLLLLCFSWPASTFMFSVFHDLLISRIVRLFLSFFSSNYFLASDYLPLHVFHTHLSASNQQSCAFKGWKFYVNSWTRNIETATEIDTYLTSTKKYTN
jgi:hypothetical protein